MLRTSALILFLIAAAGAQEPAFESEVSLVEVDAEVIGNGRVIDGLQLRDFVITDNHQPVALRYCVEEEAALDLALVFDLSQHMERKLSQLTVASEMAIAEVRRLDRLAVLSFDQKLKVELALTSDLKEVKRLTRIGLADARFGNAFLSLLDAATGAARYLSGQPGPHQRGVVLMFTGDIGNGKKEDHLAAARTFWNDDTLLSAMVIPSRLTRFTHDDNPLHFRDIQFLGHIMKFSAFDSVDELAAMTGAEIIYTALRQLMERMRQRYRLYYDRPAGRPGKVREIGVALSSTAQALHPDARIVARKGYVVPRSDSAGPTVTAPV